MSSSESENEDLAPEQRQSNEEVSRGVISGDYLDYIYCIRSGDDYCNCLGCERGRQGPGDLCRPWTRRRALPGLREAGMEEAVQDSGGEKQQ